MQRCEIEPGLLPTFRIFVVFSAVATAVGARLAAPVFHFRDPFPNVLLIDAFSLLFLMIYTSWPWVQQKTGWAFLPLALIGKAVQPVVGSYLTLSGFVPPASWEYFALTGMVRLFLNAEVIVIFTAWQYELAWPLAVGAALTALNAVLALPYIHAGPLYSLYLTIIVTQLMTVGASGLAIGLLVRN